MSRRLVPSVLAVLFAAFVFSACCGTTCIKEPPCKPCEQPSCGCPTPAK